MHRRHFLSAASLAAVSATISPGLSTNAEAVPIKSVLPRDRWLLHLQRMQQPLWANLEAGTLRANMIIAHAKGQEAKLKVAHLEAIGRSLVGLGPWLAAKNLNPGEAALQESYRESVLKGLANMSHPGNADYIDFGVANQNLVDAAFFCYGLMLAQEAIWPQLSSQVQARLLEELVKTRQFKPYNNNWLLFSAMVELFIARHGGAHNVSHLPEVIENALARHEEWYKGDGHYGDGPEYHADYYNSYVIQPFLVFITQRYEPAATYRDKVWARARRFAVVQERMIGADGSFPPVGRSLVYRCGAFHHLAFMAQQDLLPAQLPVPAVREALYATIDRTLSPAKTYDKGGWLNIGLCGYQPNLGEVYITTGSLYLASFAFLPLGLEPSHPFWAGKPEPFTAQRLWTKGADQLADSALKG